jgi:dipeptidyl aminopeptidase/acylaminoacyl peptidase
MSQLLRALVFIPLSLILPIFGHGQATTAPLQLETIMRGPDFIGHLPENPRWSAGGRVLYFDWQRDSMRSAQPHGYTLSNGRTWLLNDQENQLLPSSEPVYTRDRSKSVYSSQGDLFLTNHRNGATQQITNTLASERLQGLSADEQYVLFEIDNNLFSWSVANGNIRQHSHFKSGTETSSPKPSTQAAWLERDQLELFEVLRERKSKIDSSKALAERLAAKRPKAIYTGKNRLSSQRLSPDMRFVHYQLYPASDETATVVPDYVTESGYTDPRRARSKVGGEPKGGQYWLYDTQRDTAYQLDFKQLPGIYQKPAYLREYLTAGQTWVDTTTQPRELRFLPPVFSPNGQQILLDIRAIDNKDRWLVLLDAATGKLQTILRERNEAWIGGPAAAFASKGFIDNQRLWYLSEKTGYSHLYLYELPSQKTTALSSGNFEVLQVQLSNDQQYFYVHANKTGPHEQHFYRLRIANQIWTALTSQKGKHEVVLSPDETQMAILFSASNQPTELFLAPTKAPQNRQQLTQSTTEAFRAHPWRQPEIVRFIAADSAQVPARLYKPTNSNGAAIIFVHGAGYLQNVHHWWSQYYREYMFHHLLSDMGYTVLDIDYRGSAGYGGDWRTAIYRHMGGKDLSDQVDGARYLVQQHGIDAQRIGIYGGSYGGFITLMALTTQPGVFASGAALRSVADWAHYNQGYTSNILNLPHTDSLAYRRSSPIYHAQGLQGELLMLHGMVDMNVHFQDVVRFSQRLIELRKDRWELAVFPLEDHGFVESSSWIDEYKRILRLFERSLKP